jgi:uncharacterized membrane protein YwzB
MIVLCLIISYFARNGVTVDELGSLLAMGAVVILIMVVVIIRAAVGSFIQRFPTL